MTTTTTPSQYTRAVLSEIPDRTEYGATTPTTELADEPTPANILNNTLPNNFDSSYQSSPDELMIRQRGRRRIKLSWSPEKYPTSTRYPFQKTPTKSTTGMTLRSSPRKRPANCPDVGFRTPEKRGLPSPRKCTTEQPAGRTTGTPLMKRLRLEERPFAQLSTETPLQTLLGGLSHDQLIGMIDRLVQGQPELEEKVRDEFPMPDLSPMGEELLHLKRNIFRSLPSSRLVKKTDSVAYSRVSIHLSAFKKTIVTQSRTLYNSRNWDALVDYVLMAWPYVRATPIWENSSHNTIRRHCFKVLACHCNSALRYGGIGLGHQRLLELDRQSKEMSRDSEDIVPVMGQLMQILQKFQTL